MRLLLVDDEDDFRISNARWMMEKGHHVQHIASGAAALSMLQHESFDVAVFDINMPGMSGLELLQRVREDGIDLEIVMLTGEGTLETAVTAMQMGACDFLTKPCSLGDLEHHCQLAADRHQLRKENQQLKAVISRSRCATKLVGRSNGMEAARAMIAKVAPTDSPVLIQGESGTGKEVVAQAIQPSRKLGSNLIGALFVNGHGHANRIGHVTAIAAQREDAIL